MPDPAGAPALRGRLGERTTGFVLALMFEGLLVLAVISLAWVDAQPPRKEVNMVSVALRSEEVRKPEAEAKPKEATRPLQHARQTPTEPLPVPAVKPPAALPVPQIVPLTKQQMNTFDIANLPRAPAAPARPMMGPADTGVAGDSKRVGTTPGGQPMYAATWYREPSDDELRGYLSTASPGWALISCRTAPDFRVEACVPLDEYPSGSNMLRAVLAATWQFKVRPPRVGGVAQVGAWVRIRIEYSQRRN